MTTATSGSRWIALGPRLMLAALVPALTYMGHWPSEIPVPGTSYYIGHPRTLQSRSDAVSAAHEHAQHCHGDASSCSDVPASGGATTLAILAAAAGLAGMLVPLRFASRRSSLSRLKGLRFGPQPPPPRSGRRALVPVSRLTPV